MRLSRRQLAWIYFIAVGALIVTGVILWTTGHGTGDPYLSFGIALAFAPLVVNWVRERYRERFNRD